MNIFSTVFQMIKEWFAPSKPAEPTPEQLFSRVDSAVEQHLRAHPEQIPAGVTLPPEPKIKFSYTRKRSSPEWKTPEDGVRFDLGDEPDSQLLSAVQAQVGENHRQVTSFSRELMNIVNLRFAGLAPAVYRAAHLSRQTYSAIISDEHHQVARGTALALLFALHCTEEEAEWMLQKAGFSLSDALLADVICKCCMRKQVWDLDVVNQVLEKYHCNTLP